jgi:hypothetical protein
MARTWWRKTDGHRSACRIGRRSLGWDRAAMRFDPDMHRAHQTFETACLERYRTASGAKRRRIPTEAAAR